AGISLAKLERYEEAIDYLKKFDGNDQMVAPSVLRTIGDCYAHLGDNAAAVKYLVKAADVADNNSISPACLLSAGKIYEQMGEKSKALKLYERIEKEYPASYQAMDIEKHIEYVK
ncbi:MAG: tetratricopeptide repeat protein, partial [Bacteroidaceae bacterium]|nr:tetratricopeptide repeat protein [Bacteroidaceae bacterium]